MSWYVLSLPFTYLSCSLVGVRLYSRMATERGWVKYREFSFGEVLKEYLFGQSFKTCSVCIYLIYNHFQIKCIIPSRLWCVRKLDKGHLLVLYAFV